VFLSTPTAIASAMQLESESEQGNQLLHTLSDNEGAIKDIEQTAGASVNDFKHLVPWGSRTARGILLAFSMLGVFMLVGISRAFSSSTQYLPPTNTKEIDTIELWRGSGAAHIVWPPAMLQHAGDDCWKACNETGGDCSWCGSGNACCRWNSKLDPEECQNVKNFATHAHHTCVQPTYPVMVKHQGQDCWKQCNSTGGYCDWCGQRNACCRKGQVSDPAECRMALYFPTDKTHTCVATTAGCPIGSIDNGNGECVKPPIPQLLSFYFYRAKSADMYADTNVNGGNLAGVMWYIHNEVMASSCPRKYSIDRIQRYKLTMKATQALYDKYKINFDLYRQFDKGRCTHVECEQTFKELGYVVGCINNNPNVANYTPFPIWYDLPGPCPSRAWDQKTFECMKSDPGGQCQFHDPVTGAFNCTWKLENAGFVTLDQVTGIKSYEQFCTDEKKEYVRDSDAGVDFHFWDGIHDAAKCTARMDSVQAKFKEKYPYLPVHLGEPLCDGYR